MTYWKDPNKELELEGHCYVLPQVDQIHPIAHHRHLIVWYPERAMSIIDRIMYQPYDSSIVTECPWIIATYDREFVLVVGEDGKWELVDHQTYGTSNNKIRMSVLGIRQTIPSVPLDGGAEMIKWHAEWAARYKKAKPFKG